EDSMLITKSFQLRTGFLLCLFTIVSEQLPNTALPAQPESLKLSYSALVLSGAPFWIAQEQKLFEREGLKTELLYINSAPRVMAAMLAGEIQLALAGVSPLVSTYAQGNDAVAIAGAVNQINVAIFARPEIRAPEDLRGKRLGITRFGGLTDFSAQY